VYETYKTQLKGTLKQKSVLNKHMIPSDPLGLPYVPLPYLKI
jgi:hypothetical protein